MRQPLTLAVQLKAALTGLCAAAFCFSFSGLTAWAQQSALIEVLFHSTPAPARVINFPTDRSLGLIVLLPGKSVNRARAEQLAARGKIYVPEGYISLFDAEQRFFADPKIIKTFSPDAFDSIKMSATAIDDSEEGQVDRALAQIGHLSGLYEVNLDKSDATDVGISKLGALPRLQRVTLFNTAIDGSCLKQLATVKTLENLRLSKTSLKHENLKYLSQMRGLRSLSLTHLRLNDSAVSNISGCTNMYWLDLSNNPDLTDNCLKYLVPLKKLSEVNLTQTKTTLRGLLQLKGSLALKKILCSEMPYTAADLAAFRKALPGVKLSLKARERPVDIDTGAIFAPMH